jgi:hypothetical protein
MSSNVEKTIELAGPVHTWPASWRLREARDRIRNGYAIDDIHASLMDFIDEVFKWPPHEEGPLDGYYYYDDRTPKDEIIKFADRLLEYYNLLDRINDDAAEAP